MKFRIQTDGEKFRVQKRFWSVYWWDWATRPWGYFDTRAEAEAWIDEQEQTKPKWETI